MNLMSLDGSITGSMWAGLDPKYMDNGRRSVERIIAAVVAETGVCRRELAGPWKDRRISRARQIAYFIMRHHTSLSLPQIGRRVGGKHHTSVMAGIHCVCHHPELYQPALNRILFTLGLGPPKEIPLQ